MELILDGPGLSDSTLVGHKFARQDVMRRAGLPVPELFCLTGAAFHASVPAPTGFPGGDAGTAELIAWASAARDRIRAGRVPPSLAERVLTAVDALADADGLVAVRACVVADADGTGEDGADDPFAGLSDSFLYVDRDAVLARIVDCWASAYNPEAVLYRVRRGVDATAVRIAVGVQRMVPGVRSFVVFTRDPRTGADRRVIAAAHGIGEGIVQEKADIDHFFVDGQTGAIEVDRVSKAVMVGLDPARPAAGVTTLPVPAELAEAPVLTDAEVSRICALAARVEDLLGGPQDIEGTLTEDGTVHLVQARPVVVSPPPASGPDVPWTNHNLTESFPGLTSALTYSQAQIFYRMGFSDFYRRMGVSERSLRQNRHHLSRMVGCLDGRVYYRLDAWFTLHGQIPGFELMRPLWERSLGLTERTGMPGMSRRRPWLTLMHNMPRLAWMCARQPRQLRLFLRWWDALVADSVSIGERPADELIAQYRHMWAEAEQRWGITMVTSYFGLAGLAVTGALLKRWIPGGDALLPRLLAGGTSNRTIESLRSAIALAELVNERPSLRNAVLEQPERQVWDEISAGRHGADVAGAFRRHVATFGDRALHDLKLEVLTPRQQPWMILPTLRPFIAQRLTVADNVADEARTKAEARRVLRDACPNPLRRAVLGTVLAFLRFAVKAREDTRFCRSQLYGVSREVFCRLADQLVASGMLDEAADVVHLQVEEVLGAFDGTLPDRDLRALVRVRKEGMARAADNPDPPAYFTTPAGLPVPVALESRQDTEMLAGMTEDGVLHGLASSSGRVRARAKVVQDASMSPESCTDRILVAKETDPGWLALMMAAKGIVVERGSLISHTAISGRLLGIPTVVAVPGAMTVIPDGAWLEIDGDTGQVRLLSEPESRESAE
ncbi:PEP/pyruvate-binding domain-containing protein [Streptomyces rishiriensis]|uniref:PEP/pyruvate-binding domain-containing protein n=1 Tax=Streptomyces rishiriensis TaxID=68264 RepID=UPI000D597F88|nr:PEP/pyruvate-binding domain-containing protein [Streptomyces rishiriensis]